METKTIEIRDHATFLPALAVRLKPGSAADRYLLARAGFGRSPEGQAEYVLLIQINGGAGRSECDPAAWGDRTWMTAHQHILETWDALESGAVVDVRFVLGETEQPIPSESAGDPWSSIP